MTEVELANENVVATVATTTVNGIIRQNLEKRLLAFGGSRGVGVEADPMMPRFQRWAGFLQSR